IALLARLDDAVAADRVLRGQLDLDELPSPEPLLHVGLVRRARPRVLIGVEHDLAHEAAARRDGEGGETLVLGVEAQERVRGGAGDPDVASLAIRVQGVRLLGVPETRRTRNASREIVYLPALERGIEAPEHPGAVARHPDDAVGAGAEAPRPIE